MPQIQIISTNRKFQFRPTSTKISTNRKFQFRPISTQILSNRKFQFRPISTKLSTNRKFQFRPISIKLSTNRKFQFRPLNRPTLTAMAMFLVTKMLKKLKSKKFKNLIFRQNQIENRHPWRILMKY